MHQIPSIWNYWEKVNHYCTLASRYSDYLFSQRHFSHNIIDDAWHTYSHVILNSWIPTIADKAVEGDQQKPSPGLRSMSQETIMQAIDTIRLTTHCTKFIIDIRQSALYICNSLLHNLNHLQLSNCISSSLPWAERVRTSTRARAYIMVYCMMSPVIR